MSKAVRTISILGSTGSVGTQVLDVAERIGERVRIHSLAAGRNVDLLAEQISRWRPEFVVIDNSLDADSLRQRIARMSTQVMVGETGMTAVATDAAVDTVVVAVQGFPGLVPTIAAAEAGKDIAIASKEVLVVAGALVRDAIRQGGGKLIPIDSEHSAIFQCLVGEPDGSIEKLTLTASGGPFKQASIAQMARITPEMALNHPTWKMGRKITVDSATLMNKGLEILEAEALFGVRSPDVEVVLHPKSIVHSLVRFRDGSVKAQLGLPDMRLPIQYALLYPERIDTQLPRLDLLECGTLEFFAPDCSRFPALDLARAAGKAGGIIPAIMSAADDVAVESFLNGCIGFMDIISVVKDTMNAATNIVNPNLESIVEADRWARVKAAELCMQHGNCQVGA